MKNLYLVYTESGRRWEIIGGRHLVLANDENEIRNLTFNDEKIVNIKKIEDLKFENNIYTINRSIEE